MLPGLARRLALMAVRLVPVNAVITHGVLRLHASPGMLHGAVSTK
jgi:hypothetical protein